MSSPTPSLAETMEAPPAAASGVVQHAPVPARSPSTGGEAQVLQERLALYAMVGTLFSTASLLLMAAAHALSAQEQQFGAYGFHVLGIALCAASWRIAKGPPRSKPLLEGLDTGMTVAIAACFAFETVMLPGWMRPDLVSALTAFLISTMRAILVPSSPRRTVAISTVAWLPIFVVAYVAYAKPFTFDGQVLALRKAAMLEGFIWAALGIGLATVTSRIIYGLRREVREAQKLGQYTLLEKLGEGGMGQVFRAQHAMLRRPTAVKLLHPDRMGGVEDLARFEREVQLTAQLSHPNVVTVFDYGRTPDGVFYYAMELLEGRNLEDVVAQGGAMKPARAVHILTQVASALAEAHAVGLIHRDIKPANIILCARGRALDVAKVVDFGLVKQLGGEPAAPEPAGNGTAASAGSSDVSRTGTILGTPMYLAPETMGNPGSVDGRADLYALGAVAYFLLTGTVVFGGATVMEACGHHLHSVPESPSARLRGLRPDRSIPTDLEAIVLQCLAKSPADRHASAIELLDALTACSIAGEWTEADARDAWAASRDLSLSLVSGGARTETSWTAKTIAVDRVG